MGIFSELGKLTKDERDKIQNSLSEDMEKFLNDFKI